MNLTPEQSDIVAHFTSSEGLTMVSAVAGAGKTTLLVSLANSLSHSNGLYLAFNKKIATEAKSRFPSTTHCCTTHSFAYGPTVVDHKLKLGLFTYRQVLEPIPYERKCELVDLINEFCLSEFTTFSDFVQDPQLTPLANKYLSLMQSGSIECTHAFYLKYFHILLASNHLSYEPFDFIMLDESGDLNPVTLAIFNLLPSPRKIMVGDALQNIYGFNHTINCFEVMKHSGTTFPMSQSFRVSDLIASRIQTFCRRYLDPNMNFVGIPATSSTIHSRAYISRTNSQLVSKMMELNKLGTPYSLTRPAKQIFRVPLLVCGLRPGGFIPDPEYKHLQVDVDTYAKSATLQRLYSSLFSYLKELHADDSALQTAMSTVIRYGAKAIIECFNEAKRHEHSRSNYTLTTSHACKGCEYDEVEIADDLNKSIKPLLELTDFDSEQQAELNLYYVGVSRARINLINSLI